MENLICNPEGIEKRSFEIITELLGERRFSPLHEPIVKRVIHTTADFDYADLLQFSPVAVARGIAALGAGGDIVTDTQMAAAGINKKALARFGSMVHCFIAEEQLAREARLQNRTRSALSMEKAVQIPQIKIYVIGNAPTALIRLCELIREGAVAPELVIGVPVGFVNVLEAKAMLKEVDAPHILSEGRKGGSNVAAAIVNALLYLAAEKATA